MSDAWKRVAYLVENRAVHRKGFCLANATPIVAATHHIMESGELLNEIVFRPDDREKILFEVADCMSCLIHLSQMLGFSESDVDSAIIQKLNQRFSIPEQSP